MSASPAIKPILNPREVPVVGADVHLPALPAEALTPASLRAVFAAPEHASWVPELPGDGGRLFAERPTSAAAVLVPLVQRDELMVLLTRRTDHLRDHAGQISFPGGRAEPDDADPVATALREAQEEVGLSHRHVEVIGALPPYMTVTAFQVTPVVALVQPDFQLQIDPFEVSEVFEVPLSFLMSPRHHRRHQWEADGQQRQFLSMPWMGLDFSGRPHEYFIWGATAAMLRNLYARLQSAVAPASPGGPVA